MKAAMSTTSSNQIFDWGRFTAALRKEVVENKRQLLLIVASIFLFFMVSMILGNVISNSVTKMSDYEGQKVMDFMPAIFVSSVYTVIVIVVASLSFRNLTSKTGRVSLFTSPASMTEKFTVNLVIYVIGAFVAFLVCAQLADLARIAILKPFETKNFLVPGPMNFFTILTGSSFDIMGFSDLLDTEVLESQSHTFKLMALFSIFLGPAMYFMGSVLWPRWSVVKTFAAQQVINGVVNFFLMLIFAMPLLYLGTDHKTFSESDASTLVQSISTGNYIIYAICLVCWYGAWYLFKRKDVVSLKWWS